MKAKEYGVMVHEGNRVVGLNKPKQLGGYFCLVYLAKLIWSASAASQGTGVVQILMVKCQQGQRDCSIFRQLT